MKNLFFMPLFFVLFQASFAQSDFRSSYLLTLEQDTVYGFIDYRESKKNMLHCRFKASADADVVTFTPTEINGFGFFGDRVFESKTIVSQDGEEKTYFFEVLVSGELSLYKADQDFFVESPQASLTRLTAPRTMVQQGGKQYVQDNNQHIRVMNALTADCPSMKTKVASMGSGEKSFTQIVENYNECKGVEYVTYKGDKEWLSVKIAPMIGVGVSQANFVAGDPDYRDFNGFSDYSVSPILGMTIDFSNPRMSERISLTLNPMIQNHRYSVSTISEAPFLRNTYNMEVSIMELKLPVGFTYKFTGKTLSPFFRTGLSYTHHLRRSSSSVRERLIVETLTIFEGEGQSLTRSQFGLWAALGIQKSWNKNKALFFEARAEQTGGMNNNVGGKPASNHPPSVVNFQFLTGIYF
ncbi:outer membrane beta-barrel protein [Pararhodonellum marinum]|uniref:outer membrane beta-barrel protein n=1 Tax=Pararhodonellum marinum TaxID=2755358 RepID=UPI00188E85F0|nr:outer membrane beta-barrel protein [Pararhodonellum marinum]